MSPRCEPSPHRTTSSQRLQPHHASSRRRRRHDHGKPPDRPVAALTDDAHLDATSRQLLAQLDDIKRLEQEKRAEARSSDEFHELAEEISDRARGVWALAEQEETSGSADSPLPEERDERYPGDWSDARAG